MTLSHDNGPVAAALVAIMFGSGAILLAGGRRGRWLVPVSGLLLVGVAIFGLAPELIRAAGWWRTLGAGAVGYGILALLDHRGYPVCPSCSHGEKFAGSLVAATACHAFIDGWGMAATSGHVGTAIAAAILLHKIPEGLALGTMLRISTPRLAGAAGLLLLSELPTVAGGMAGRSAPPGWVSYPLAVAGGTFLFLGMHAVRGWIIGIRTGD